MRHALPNPEEVDSDNEPLTDYTGTSDAGDAESTGPEVAGIAEDSSPAASR